MGWVTTEHPTTDELNACVQCGLCLPACPTFRLTGRETASPRGRLQAMKAVHQGVLEVDGPFQGIIDFCLGCRACEPVCPGMVHYGRALEGTRAEIVAQRPSWAHRVRSFFLGPVLGSRSSLRVGSAILAMAQPVRHPSHRRRRRASPSRDLVVRQALVEQSHRMPPVCHRLDLRQGAEVSEETLRLLRRPQGKNRLEEIVCLARSPFV